MKSIVWMYKVVLIAALLASVRTSQAQVASTLPIDPSNPEFREQFNHLDFNGKFVLLATSDETNNYYLVDFTQLPAKFEKVWFMNLIFRSDQIVNIDPMIDHDRIWFLSNKRYKEQGVLDEFLELKAKTKEVSANMTETEKTAWMKTNDKYK